jgi:hypothetical protein
MITGAMKTTATDVLDIMANLIPFYLLVDKHQHRAALRLATLPTSHPLNRPVMNASQRLIKRHPTPLHDLMHRYNIQPQKVETIKAVRYDTKWKPQVTINIADTETEAICEQEHDNPDVRVYTDRSGMEGNIGAAAVLYRGGRMKTELRLKLGSQDTIRYTRGKQ